MIRPFLLFACMTLITANAFARSVSADNAELYIVSPADGALVTNPVTIRFGLKNMGVAPAGIKMENTGHHHLLIDTALSDLTLPIPKDEQHRHFGKGQTETELYLSPGQHTLQLLLGDFSHIPHDPPVISRQITITIR